MKNETESPAESATLKPKGSPGAACSTLTADEKLKLIEEPARRAISQLRILANDTTLGICEEGQCNMSNLALWLEGVLDEEPGYMPWCAETAWLPISTAPKDGTVILTDAGSCAWVSAGGGVDEGWYLCGCGESPATGDEFWESYPKHWMKYPSLPNEDVRATLTGAEARNSKGEKQP